MALSEKEFKDYEVLMDAMWEVSQYGKTELKCPRCGNRIIVEENNDSSIAKCATKGCLTLTRRGL